MRCREGAEIAAFTVLTFIIGKLPNAVIALSAQQIVLQYTLFVVLISFGLAQSVGILVSQSHGKNDFDSVRINSNAAVVTGTFFMCIILLLFSLLPNQLIAFFINIHAKNNIEILKLASTLLYIAGITQIFDSIRNIAAGALRGLSDAHIPMLINVFCCWVVGIPLAYVFAFYFEWGVVGVATGFAIGIVIGALAIFARFHRLLNSQNSVHANIAKSYQR